MSWELRAREVRSLENEFYEAGNPLLKTYGKSGVRTEAKSSSGVFDLKAGHAFGKDLLSDTLKLATTISFMGFFLGFCNSTL